LGVECVTFLIPYYNCGSSSYNGWVVFNNSHLVAETLTSRSVCVTRMQTF
jgi:hypothetical protein